jgi:hypothetical protein
MLKNQSELSQQITEVALSGQVLWSTLSAKRSSHTVIAGIGPDTADDQRVRQQPSCMIWRLERITNIIAGRTGSLADIHSATLNKQIVPRQPIETTVIALGPNPAVSWIPVREVLAGRYPVARPGEPRVDARPNVSR